MFSIAYIVCFWTLVMGIPVIGIPIGIFKSGMIKQTSSVNLEELTSDSVLKIEKIDENQAQFTCKKKDNEYCFNIDYNDQKLFYGDQQFWELNTKALLNINAGDFCIEGHKDEKWLKVEFSGFSFFFENKKKRLRIGQSFDVYHNQGACQSFIPQTNIKKASDLEFYIKKSNSWFSFDTLICKQEKDSVLTTE